MAATARPRLRRDPPGRAGRARHAGDVRAGRRGDRRPGGRDVRGVRLVRDAAARRLRRPMRDRLQAQAALAVTGGVLRLRGHARVAAAWLAAVAMALVAFGVLFAGVVSSVLAGATTSLLLAFILPGLAARARVGDPRSARRLGPGVGGRAARHRAAVAGAGARPVRSGGDRGLPRAGRAAARGGRLRPRRRADAPSAERDAAIARADERGRGAARACSSRRPTGRPG